MDTEKLPPYDVEAEEAVIGSLLVDGEAMFEVATFLTAEDFFSPQNKWIYEACYSLYERNTGINQITVADELARQGKLEEIGGVSCLSQLVATVPTSHLIEDYAQIVSRLSVMRKLISASSRIATIGYETEPDVDVALSKAEDILFNVKQRRGRGDFVHLKNILGQYFQEVEPVSDQEQIPHILTGFESIDDVLVGLQRSSLIVLGARTSVGKTSMALNIARNAAVNQGACVAIFSLEMSRQEAVQRLLSTESNVTSKTIRIGNYTEEEERRIMEAAAVLSEANAYMDDSAQLRVVEMRSKARRLHFEHPIDLIIVDYLQLIKGDGRSENRVQELGEITRSLKALARDLNVPVLALSQLRREPEYHRGPPRRPQLSDLRESGSIEQDADVVLLIHRDELYYSKDDWEKQFSDVDYPRGIADIIIAKNRNGPVGELKLRFIAEKTKFANLVAEQSPSLQSSIERLEI